MLKKERTQVKKTTDLVRFTKGDSEYFREIILKRREKILREMGLLTESTRASSNSGSNENSTYSLHMADQGTDAQEREKTFLLASRDGKYLKYLNRALEMIKDGTYGYCTDCSSAIQKKRLELVPTSRLCISCKLKEEQSRRR